MNIGDLNISTFVVGDSEAVKLCLGEQVVWENASPEPDYSEMYLTFEVLSGGNLYWYASRDYFLTTIQYSINNGPWQSITSSNNYNSEITANTGDIIRFKGENDYYSHSAVDANYFDSGSMIYNIYGNILSMIYGDNFRGHTEFPSGSSNNFRRFFYGSKAMTAENLILPDNVTEGCYGAMFQGSLIEKAPVLPATGITYRSYSSMFRYCQNLNYVKCLAVVIPDQATTSNWLQGVSASGTFVKNPNMSSWTTGESGIPSGWTVQDAVL